MHEAQVLQRLTCMMVHLPDPLGQEPSAGTDKRLVRHDSLEIQHQWRKKVFLSILIIFSVRMI